VSGLIVPHKGFVPRIAPSAFIAPNATLVGDVEIGENASIWFGVILRGDGPGIRIGENSNLQVGMHSTVLDGAVVESGAMVAAGALVAPGKIVRRGELWAGNPARKLRDLAEKDFVEFRRIVADYVTLARSYGPQETVKAAD
jgi:gamma-carbonic anhydrase